MLYCADCQRLALPDTPACGGCGGQLRQAAPNDPALLLSLDPARADMVAPLLADAGIPFSKVGRLGEGFTLRAGALLETFRFYVPYAVWARAYDLIVSVLGEDAVVTRSLSHAGGKE